MADSTGSKPQKKFPLFVHKGSGRWCKKVRYRHVYFGRVADDPEGTAALELWHKQKDDLLAGRDPRDQDTETVYRLKDLANEWLSHKKALVASGELAQRSFDDYKLTTDYLVETIGAQRTASDIGPSDFAKMRKALVKRYNAQSVAKRIQHIRSLFNHAYEEQLLENSVRYGKSFDKPRAKVLRKIRQSKGRQDFTAAEVRSILTHCGPNIKAMVLLGVQAGFGNTDVAELEEAVIDFKTGWLEWARAKTSTDRRIPLWRETASALRAAIKQRPKQSPLVFIGPRGEDYVKNRRGYRVAAEFNKACKLAKVSGRGFYCLRRTFQTIAEESQDLPAVAAIMGHTVRESDMPGRYRQGISDERLKAVTDAVHAWLYGEQDSKRSQSNHSRK